ncbi:MAG: metal-sensing transcriptional repressor [Chloroflexota bacterium]
MDAEQEGTTVVPANAQVVPTHSGDGARAGDIHHHAQRKQVVNRLARIEGHVRAIKRMAEAERACTDLLVQLAAVRAAVEQVSRVVLADHVESCLRGAAASGTADEEWTSLKEALDRFIA